MANPLLLFLILGSLIHTQADMNRAGSTLDSHRGQERWSSLEPIHRYTSMHASEEFLPSDLPPDQRTPFYPRIKKMEDGRYLLLLQGGKGGSRVYSHVSDDYLNWYERNRIAGPEKIKTDGRQDWRRYITSDALVMPSGEILAALSFKAERGFSQGKGCGIMLFRSKDAADSWKGKQIIYDGPCSDPCLLLCPDGRLQCYFTDINPLTGSSCTSLVESFDEGKTWSSKKAISRQFKYWAGGERVFTDQMPVYRLLNDGKTLFGIEEARLEPEGIGGSSVFGSSLVWNNGPEWKSLGDDAEGPADKKKNILRGGGGYIATFPSGEVVVSACIGGYQSLKIGDSGARSFNGGWDKDWLQPFDKRGNWGTCEAVDDHHLAYAIDCNDGLMMGMAYLNHTIEAPLQQTQLDGDSREWVHTQAFFIGSDSPRETIFRFSTDGGRLLILAEHVGDVPMELILHDAASKKISRGHSLSLKIEKNGLVSPINGVECVCREGKTRDGAAGYIAEIAVPLSALGIGQGSTLSFYASVAGDSFTGATPRNPGNWPRVKLTGGVTSEVPVSEDLVFQKPALKEIEGTYVVIPEEVLCADVPSDLTSQRPGMYPRIKKMADGRYIMFYHGGRLGSRIFCMDSDDLITWSRPRMLLYPEYITVDGENDVRRYVNPDAIVLPDGEILMVASFRAAKHYGKGIGSGLVLMSSTDNGKTWSAPRPFYDGPNWEPYLLLLPDGRIQCYFTDATPQSRNSGTSVMTSSDGGKTWGPKIRCSRQFKYLYDGPNDEYLGARIFTDQMPCFRVLKDGKTIVGFLEARLEEPASNQGESYFRMSVVYNDGLDWKDLGEDEAGPARRENNVLAGAAGYVSVFPSGEVLLSCNKRGRFRIKLLTEKATLYPGDTWTTGWVEALTGEGGGYWGSTEIISDDKVVVAMHCKKGIQVCQYQLIRQ